MEMKEKVRQLMKEYELEHEQDNILESLYECVRCMPTCSEQPSIGSSKFGGYPHLPVGMSVPVYKEQPLTLLAQLNLSDIPFIHQDLPRSGMLYFFYYCSPPDVDKYLESPWGEFEERNGWRVVYIEEVKELHIVQEEGAYAYPESLLTFEKVVCLENDIYFEDEGDYDKYYKVLEEIQGEHIPLHQLFGHPQAVQNPVFEESECYAENNVSKNDWELLFQIDSDEEFLDMWGDVGMLYFCIPKDSLKNQRFEDSWMIMQCH
ncbi:YwqG family protein [Priestia taiwanensis]|uniref:DUF1963 domain-containing protein n=1 Tax=Priestia taiwanensis TaxID=1347902 RepID=A0A917EQB8_9BACI|nr:YwqG family protein [Priestia taiwanensis]MBM7363700.1 uncharacterized protein YwqG [Priestia taiwanensis]GGE74830.1 hypothetical protein GCM10007140_25870 [Priestia taiwanensis]